MSVHGHADRILGAGERVVLIAGSFGSGKTEVSVNLALRWVGAGRNVRIADLDLVNPYFRCREARRLMERHGIRVVMPPGAQAWADLPIIVPEIRGMLHPPADTISIFDVGGDEVGARALAAFRTAVADGEYELWQVINARRPFTDTVAGCLQMMRALERASRFRVTGLLANTHLIEDTTPEVILDGWRLAREVSACSGVPVRCVALIDHLAEAPELATLSAPRLRLRRRMLPPWLQRETVETDGAASAEGQVAPRPLGRPGPVGRG